MFRSLTLKYTLAFGAASLLAIVFIAVFASQITQRSFRNYLNTQTESLLIDELADLYRSSGGWQAVGPRAIGMVIIDSAPSVSPRNVAVIDLDGKVIFPSRTLPLGRIAPRRVIMQGIPIEVDGRTVGTLITPTTRLAALNQIVTKFSRQINLALIWGGFIALAISVGFGYILSKRLTNRLGNLTTAIQSVAAGELSSKVPVETNDEVGQLASAFNQMSAELERSRELRRQMTADIAHELRTPLSIILGRAETLAEGMLEPSPQVYRVIYDEARRINRLVEDLRLLSLSDAGELRLERRPASVKSLLASCADIFSEPASRKQVSIHYQLDHPPREIIMDPDRIKQVLDNLVSNAIRYTPEGGAITISAVGREQSVEISVSNTGPGIPPEELPYVFERFYRGDKSRQREEGGSGLGLAIAKSLVQAHGGDMRVSSQPGQGTVFTFWLPL
jgi:signal transduction histidine kinase